MMKLTDLNTGLDIVEVGECFELLASEEVGRLAVIISGHPEIFPVNYVVDLDVGIVFRTEAGTKLAGAVGGPVAFEVDHLERATRSGWSVILHGTAHHASPAQRDRIGPLLRPWTGTPKSHLVRVTPTSVTGRRIPGDGAPPAAEVDRPLLIRDL